MTKLLSDTLHEWAGEARVPHDLADRALRGRAGSRRRAAPIGLALLATGLATVVAVSGLTGPAVRPAGVTLPPRPSPVATDVRADPEHAPPTRLVTAGRLAVSAFHTVREEAAAGLFQHFRRSWSVYDPRTGGYRPIAGAWVDVAPGLRVAAVVDGDHLGRRVGVLDLETRRYLTWIELEHPVAAVTWSPDGTRLLATAYRESPDRYVRGETIAEPVPPSPRTGFYVIDVRAGTADYRALPPRAGQRIALDQRADLAWSLDGGSIYEPTSSSNPDRVFYTLAGEPRDAPAGQRYAEHTPYSALSPDGRRAIGTLRLPTVITDSRTGAEIAQLPVLEVLAWADDDHVVAVDCPGDCADRQDKGLALVRADGTGKPTRLTASTKSAWQWVLTPR
ncbi:hypothetical protein HII36_45125 [Nonomuraea sp. NN258]|uniref:hypothetical protein n=1 Tax=Nonomuraea antri TaxID=2730852 RepID=UPI00156A3D71|nr:hypothetical protein [Nonomuraea antri]NRQ38956.1 hypothetical protein [Nonomuraea antri]